VPPKILRAISTFWHFWSDKTHLTCVWILRISLYFLGVTQAPDSNMRSLQTCFKYAFSLKFKTALQFLTISAPSAAGLSIANNGKIFDFCDVNSPSTNLIPHFLLVAFRKNVRPDRKFPGYARNTE
jgi:hypothetical protein